MKYNWTCKPLGEVGEFKRGGNFKKSDFVKDGCPCIHYGQIHMRFGVKTDSHFTNIPQAIFDKCPKAQKGDLIIAITSEDVEGSCKSTTWLGDYDVALGGHIARFRHNLNPEYVSYYFLSPQFQQAKKEYTHGFKVIEIKPSDIAKIDIPYPSRKEQDKIVSTINSQFAKIDKLKQNAEKELQEVLSCLKTTISQATSFRNGWNLDTLGELSTIKGDYGLAAPSRPYDISKNDFRYLRITDITEWGELNDDIVAADIDSDIKQEPLAEGDILFARTGATVGKTLIYRKDFGDCLFAGYLIRYRLDQKRILPRYMFYVTHSDIYYKWVAQKQKVAAQPNISAKLYNQYPIAYPSVEEQKVITSNLDHIFSKVMLLQTSYDKITKECEALKQSILREIFD